MKEIMNYKPLADKIIVERIPGEKTTSSGIILKMSEDPDRGKILAIGPDVNEVKVGEFALMNWNAAIKIEGELYCVKVEHLALVYGE
jgi:co-chaperonin GroES (HSP10)